MTSSMLQRERITVNITKISKMNINSLFVRSIETRLQLINYQTVRWRRPKKPFWLGVAKSKKFIIPQPRKIFTSEETKEMRMLGTHYDTNLKSILNFIRHDNPYLVKTSDETEEEAQKMSPSLSEEFSKSLEANKSFNEESARRREERLKKLAEDEVKEAMEFIELAEEKERERMEVIEEIVRKEKILSEKFITPENLDEAIEKCLQNVQCYDYAIDLDGKIYHGRESLYTPKKVAESSSN